MGQGFSIQIFDFHCDRRRILVGFRGENRIVKILKEQPDRLAGFFSDVGVPGLVLNEILIGNEVLDGFFIQFFDLLERGANQFSGVFAPQPVRRNTRKRKRIFRKFFIRASLCVV